MGEKMDSLYIVMPAYNEAENIKDVIEEWYPVLKGKAEESRIVVADSGSTDRTHAILCELQNKYPKLCIIADTDRFHGPKVIALYRKAINDKIDYVFQTDSDGQTDPKEFETFWDQRKKYEGIFGYRRHRGDGVIRGLVEKVVCLLLRIYFRVEIPDANAPFRLLNVNVLKKYLDKMPENYNLPNIMLTTYIVFYKERYSFQNITFKSRQGGVNSINMRKIFRIGINALKDFRKFKRDM